MVPLPDAPDDRERLLYADPNNRVLSVTQVLGWSGLTLALFLFSLNSIWLAPFMVWVFLGVGYFGLSFAANTTYRSFDLAVHDVLADRWALRERPSVDVFLPSCGEELAVIENTFHHVSRLEWNGDLVVYCLDDGGRPEVRALAARYGFRYLSRPNRGEFKKAGNLRYAYLRSHGDFIAIFDADMAPRYDFLSELIPYALEDPSVAIVQSPQFFEADPAKNWLENGAGSVQEFFYRWVMPGRDVRRSPICVGTNAVYRRAALELTDGGALVENSEDVHTGFDLMVKGFRTKYVPVVLAKGLCPNTLQSFFNQQHRWCTGSMSLLFSRKLWREPIGLRARLTFLSGMTYFLYTGLGVLVGPLPAALLVCFLPEKVHLVNYVLLLPSLLQSFVFLPLWHRAPYRLDVMRTKIVYSWAHLFAFRDKVSDRPLAWSPTGNSSTGGSSGRLKQLRIMLVGYPALCLAMMIVGAVAHMSGPFDLAYWAPLLSALLYAGVSASVLAPLRETEYAAREGALSADAAAEAPEAPEAPAWVATVREPADGWDTAGDGRRPLLPAHAHSG